MDNRRTSARWIGTGAIVVGTWGLIGLVSPAVAQTRAATPPAATATRPSVIPQIRTTDVKNSVAGPSSVQPLAPPQLVNPPAPPLPPRGSQAQPLPLPRDRYGRDQRQPLVDPNVRPTAFAEPAPASTLPAATVPKSLPTQPPAAANPNLPGSQPSAAAGEHPLMPAITRARSALESIAKIQDYSATLVKRERIDGTLGEHQYMFVKVRHEPFSVYLYFLAPGELKGQESIYIVGKNDGNLLAHANGFKGKLLGTVSLSPTGMLAMSGNRYPITEIGIKRLSERLIEVGTNDMKYGECAMKILPGAKINGRDCTCYEVLHPQPRKEFIFHLARIYLDSELNVPIRYEAYDWPSEAGGPPVLVEEYTYLNLKLNNGFNDLDFDVSNPKYQFK